MNAIAKRRQRLTDWITPLLTDEEQNSWVIPMKEVRNKIVRADIKLPTLNPVYKKMLGPDGFPLFAHANLTSEGLAKDTSLFSREVEGYFWSEAYREQTTKKLESRRHFFNLRAVDRELAKVNIKVMETQFYRPKLVPPIPRVAWDKAVALQKKHEGLFPRVVFEVPEGGWEKVPQLADPCLVLVDEKTGMEYIVHQWDYTQDEAKYLQNIYNLGMKK